MQKFTTHINPKIIVAIFLEIVFVVILAYLFSLATTETPAVSQITPSNFSETLPDIPQSSKTLIEQQIYQIASENSPTGSIIDSSEATIRQDSLINLYLEPLDIHFINFIVDLPSGQYYRIVYEWSEDKDNPNILPNNSLYAMCLEYNNFNCQDSYNGYGSNYIIYNIVYNYTFDNFFVNPTITDTTLSFNIQLTDGESSTKQNAITSLENFIYSLGFNAKNYTINTEYSTSENVYQ